ncbi:unknown [Phocaeicola plebeius CAG:211]|uniref:Uncharacterized protein n=1 Tax=Phocaeicola plebeius CAG:211 TaxID=1263052 RepID=R5VE96_9BACT|nr:unknown [Phocaeicola plebeius CAG:211]
MLLFTTRHHINRMCTQCFDILCIYVIGKVVFILGHSRCVAIIVIGKRIGRIHRCLRSVRIFTAHTGVQTQIRQEMELIIHFHISYKVIAVGPVVLLFQCGHRILGCVLVGCISPVRIGEIGCSLRILIVASKHIIHAISPIHRTGRIHRQRSSNGGSGIRIAVLSVHVFGSHIDFQMIVKERRSQINRSCKSLEIRSLDNSIVIIVSQRNTVGQVLQTTIDRHMVVRTDCRTKDFILPVGISCA